MKLFCLSFLLLCACSSVHAQSSQKILNDFLDDTAVRTGFAGVCFYDPSAKKYLVDYNSEKNFLPSSNVKLFTLYAGMKYLGDSIKGLRMNTNDSVIMLYPTGDPTFLHADFKVQRTFDFLSTTKKKIVVAVAPYPHYFQAMALGSGWAWDDYAEDYMAERSGFPIYGNLISYFQSRHRMYNIPVVMKDSKMDLSFANERRYISNKFVTRDIHSNNSLQTVELKNDSAKVPFITSVRLFEKLLNDTLHKTYTTDSLDSKSFDDLFSRKPEYYYSRPVDSLFRPMMFNSDNFFAEQTLLMVSNERLGYMSDKEIIDSLLINDLKDIPTKPRWVDGSGLSRYNLFSPKDFVYILEKTEKEFGWQRLKNILPTAGQGTLKGYYENLSGLIYAKTGSMSNNVSLSGFIYGKSGKKLIFSVIINNFSGSGRSGRKAIEQLLLRLREIN